jgi:hypothetical protein
VAQTRPARARASALNNLARNVGTIVILPASRSLLKNVANDSPPLQFLRHISSDKGKAPSDVVFVVSHLGVSRQRDPNHFWKA